MKRLLYISIVILEVITMFSLLGCSKPKYKLHFDSDAFKSKATEYRPGEKVTIYYDLIGTDTDYRFWTDSEDVKMNQDYDSSKGYIFTFMMPAHDVNIYHSEQNSMINNSAVDVTFVNEVAEADIWLLPQTADNLKTTLWGKATVARLAKGDTADVMLTADDAADAWIIRIIDTDNGFYSANDIKLENGSRIIFKYSDSKFDAVLVVQDASGAEVYSAKAFTGVL